MAKKVTTTETASKPVYEVIEGKERVTVMTKGGCFKLWEAQSQKTLKFLFDLGIKNVRKNG